MLITATLVFTACKKDEVNEPEDNQETTITTNDYYPITIGSYWVYEFDLHEANGTIQDNNDIDTLKVTGDTVIDGETYFVFHTDQPSPDTEFYRRINDGEVRSSSGALVCPRDNSYSGIYNEFYATQGSDTTYHQWSEFEGYKTVTTSFGSTYDCIQRTIYNEIYQTNDTVVDTLYFSPIGILQRSASYFSGAKLVGTLIDYHIE